MRLHDLTLATPEENLALDEALLLAPAGSGEALRLWEAPTPMVVLGRSSRVEQEVDREACRRAGVPVRRRVSGGATIVAGPGCLMYAVVLDAATTPEAADIDAAHRDVLGRLAGSLDPLVGGGVRIAGTSDLALATDDGLRKFSGNSVRRVGSRLLYHGTLLYAFDLPSVPRLLRAPPRQPDYREARPHEAFLANLPADAAALRRAVVSGWGAEVGSPSDEVLAETARLAKTKYADDGWNLSR